MLLLDLRRRGEYTPDLFAAEQSAAAERVMGVMDAINARWGRGTLHPASVPTAPDWGMRRELMSQSYTTQVSELWRVGAGAAGSQQQISR
ncbi:DNA polymerase V subunit UmuC [compost metagenome]